MSLATVLFSRGVPTVSGYSFPSESQWDLVANSNGILKGLL